MPRLTSGRVFFPVCVQAHVGGLPRIKTSVKTTMLSDNCPQLTLLATKVIHLLHVNSINKNFRVTQRYVLLEQLDV